MSEKLTPAEAALRDAARDYHRLTVAGKISVTPTKPLTNQRDLSLAYSPGVAYPCLDIAADPNAAAEYTARGNLVGVVTNGTAVLGLGDIGPLAAKPVMEGKGCLFKKFAGIDVFDIELAERDPDKLIEMIAALEPTVGGINLEDIKAPECFYIERKLSERLNIPVFHDDQHGTAIIAAAAIRNGLELVGKDIGNVKLVVSGAGAAASLPSDLPLYPGATVISNISANGGEDAGGTIIFQVKAAPAAVVSFYRQKAADAGLSQTTAADAGARVMFSASQPESGRAISVIATAQDGGAQVQLTWTGPATN